VSGGGDAPRRPPAAPRAGTPGASRSRTEPHSTAGHWRSGTQLSPGMSAESRDHKSPTRDLRVYRPIHCNHRPTHFPMSKASAWSNAGSAARAGGALRDAWKHNTTLKSRGSRYASCRTHVSKSVGGQPATRPLLAASGTLDAPHGKPRADDASVRALSYARRSRRRRGALRRRSRRAAACAAAAAWHERRRQGAGQRDAPVSRRRALCGWRRRGHRRLSGAPRRRRQRCPVTGRALAPSATISRSFRCLLCGPLPERGSAL
jgi:hypothetical protein